MPKKCAFDGCKNNVFSTGYCQFHQYARTDSKWLKTIANRTASAAVARNTKRPANTSAKKPLNYNFKPIAKASKSRAVVNRLYEARSKIFRQENPYCALKIEGICTNFTQGVHHTRGKATLELLLKEEWWLPACNPCNLFCETNSAEAKELGFKVADYSSKLSKFKH